MIWCRLDWYTPAGISPLVTRSALELYGRPAMIFSASASPMPGSVFSSALFALLMSTGLRCAAGLLAACDGALAAFDEAVEAPATIGTISSVAEIHLQAPDPNLVMAAVCSEGTLCCQRRWC